MGAGLLAALPRLHKRGRYAVCETTRYDKREPCQRDWRSLPLRGRNKLREASGARAQTHAADRSEHQCVRKRMPQKIPHKAARRSRDIGSAYDTRL